MFVVVRSALCLPFGLCLFFQHEFLYSIGPSRSNVTSHRGFSKFNVGRFQCRHVFMAMHSRVIISFVLPGQAGIVRDGHKANFTLYRIRRVCYRFLHVQDRHGVCEGASFFLVGFATNGFLSLFIVGPCVQSVVLLRRRDRHSLANGACAFGQYYHFSFLCRSTVQRSVGGYPSAVVGHGVLFARKGFQHDRFVELIPSRPIVYVIARSSIVVVFRCFSLRRLVSHYHAILSLHQYLRLGS